MFLEALKNARGNLAEKALVLGVSLVLISLKTTCDRWDNNIVDEGLRTATQIFTKAK